MKNRAIGIAVAIVVAVIALMTWRPGLAPPPVSSAPEAKSALNKRAPDVEVKPPRRKDVPPAETRRSGLPVLSAAEKAARVGKIKKDYDEIRNKTAADYSAAGSSFPGGLNAFLRQLALLEREKRADFAAVLSPEELEDLELRETNAGQAVQRWLADTVATDEQRRKVFRLQHTFEDRFALTFDLTPPALLERERIRHQTQEQILTVLGDALFDEWLRGEGPDFANFVKFAAQQGLPADASLNLWRAKNDFTLRRLELSTQKLPPDQMRAAQAALAQQTEARILGIVGPGALPLARREILGWLPGR
ncbi:MAG: hypothetical protein Q7S40_06130 [Opitutaceae bacterium]|nr:hypothetical protein [Opitutaceae bacterium]